MPHIDFSLDENGLVLAQLHTTVIHIIDAMRNKWDLSSHELSKDNKTFTMSTVARDDVTIMLVIHDGDIIIRWSNYIDNGSPLEEADVFPDSFNEESRGRNLTNGCTYKIHQGHVTYETMKHISALMNSFDLLPCAAHNIVDVYNV